jgi:murein DD-endopeptidase MepM/ murein hydrolase activator NlpD
MMKPGKRFLNVIFFFMILIVLPACAKTGGDFVNGEEQASSAALNNKTQLRPDAERVYSPAQVGFDAAVFIEEQGGYLNGYTEEVDGRWMSGAQIVAEVSLFYSVNPRLLLALLEYRAGWVSEANPDYQGKYPLIQAEPTYEGLFSQLSWAANTLNRGFYTHEVGALPEISLQDGSRVTLPEDLNDASAALYYFFGTLLEYHDWELAVSPLGFYAEYVRLFGDPFQYDMGMLLPEGLAQPTLQLPFAQGERWHYTSGPHSAWGDGAAWAALDFSPPGEEFGCFTSAAWVRAAANGVIVYAENGVVLQDLDGDGDIRSGWALLYMHIAQAGRVAAGTRLQAGDAIGHPSCEGGPSTGTHTHLARRYNGVWIAADRAMPFILSGWKSGGSGAQYEGTLILDTTIIEASGYVTDENEIYW